MNKSSAIILTLAMCLPALGYGQEFGKLFTTQEERAYLDYLREEFLERTAVAGFNIDSDDVPEIPQDDVASEEIVEFHFGGIMTRRDGGRAVWLNGDSILENDLPANVTLVGLDGSTSLRLETSETSFLLKPGQTVNTSTGEFWEAFERAPGAGNLDQQPVVEEEPVSTIQALNSAEATVENEADSAGFVESDLDIPEGGFTPEQLQAIEVLRAMEISNLE